MTAVTKVYQLPIVRLFDFPVVNVTTEQAIKVLNDRIAVAQYSSVFFINAHCVNVAYQDPAYAGLLGGNPLNFADGVGVAIAARYFGETLVDNVNGTDMFPPLCEALSSKHAKVFLLGGQLGVAKELGERLSSQYSGIQIVGCHHGHFDESESEGIAEAIRKSEASVVFVAMGVPRQEEWISRWGKQTGASVLLAVGGLFNFYAGKIPRAPRWMRKAKLEWLHRLVQEPKRMWRRYLLGNLIFIVRMFLFPFKRKRRTSLFTLTNCVKSSARS